jgi:hypothetical protein
MDLQDRLNPVFTVPSLKEKARTQIRNVKRAIPGRDSFGNGSFFDLYLSSAMLKRSIAEHA